MSEVKRKAGKYCKLIALNVTWKMDSELAALIKREARDRIGETSVSAYVRGVLQRHIDSSGIVQEMRNENTEGGE